MQNEFRISIENRDGVIFAGAATSVTSRNETGKFDILPEHANFITLIKGNVEISLKDGETRQIAADNAVMKFEDGVCEVYMGIKQLGKMSRQAVGV